MNSGDLTRLSLTDLIAQLRDRQVSAEEVTGAYLKRIRELDPQIRSLLLTTEETALSQARAADRRRAEGDTASLLGVPVILKDVLLTRNIRTTAGSRMLENFQPVVDATVTRRLAEEGSVLLGKANMDEFAMGSSTENSAYFPTRNPWDLDRVPGGSSGGSAAAVAARLAAFSLGTDTGGSIRQPAALCGVVGLKPTYGRVSRFGLIAFASSLDQIGPFTRTVQDAALVLKAIAGHDSLDSTSLNEPVPDYPALLSGTSLAGLRVALPREYFETEGMEQGVRDGISAAVRQLQDLGADVGDVRLPHTEHGLASYYLLAPAECSANLARYDGVKYGLSVREDNGKDLSLMEMYEQTRARGFGPEVKRRIILGTYALSSGYYDAYYVKAQKARTLIKQDFDAVFESYDVIVTPTSPTVAFPLASKTQDPLAMYLNDLFTIPTSLAGLPAISVPAGLSQNLPVGMQIIGKPLDEATVLRVAHAYEQATPWHQMEGKALANAV